MIRSTSIESDVGAIPSTSAREARELANREKEALRQMSLSQNVSNRVVPKKTSKTALDSLQSRTEQLKKKLLEAAKKTVINITC